MRFLLKDKPALQMIGGFAVKRTYYRVRTSPIESRGSAFILRKRSRNFIGLYTSRFYPLQSSARARAYPLPALIFRRAFYFFAIRPHHADRSYQRIGAQYYVERKSIAPIFKKKSTISYARIICKVKQLDDKQNLIYHKRTPLKAVFPDRDDEVP